MTTQINQEMFNGQKEKEGRQMGAFRKQNKKKIPLLTDFSNCFKYVSVYLSLLLISFLSLDCYHFGIGRYMFGQHLTSLLLKKIKIKKIHNNKSSLV